VDGLGVQGDFVFHGVERGMRKDDWQVDSNRMRWRSRSVLYKNRSCLRLIKANFSIISI
jgi:hypothetical protein